MHHKAERYLQDLDNARCTSHWAVVPEAARKLTKHSAAHTAFARVAVIEGAIYDIVGKNDVLSKLSTTDKIDKFVAELNQLSSTTDIEHNYIHNVAYAHALLLKGEFEAAIEQLKSLVSVSKEGQTLKYTRVAEVKRQAVLGSAYEHAKRFEEAMNVYKDAAVSSQMPEGMAWAERLYQRFSKLAKSTGEEETTKVALDGYHNIVKTMQSTGARPSRTHNLDMLWENLQANSQAMQQNPTPESINAVSRLTQTYEDLLFSSAKFPHATDTTPVMERYVELLVKNWSISTTKLNGPHGTVVDPDQRTYTKKVLATLRRASLLTFHSCAVMRLQLIILSALGYYEEALLAFKTYKAYQGRYLERKQKGATSGPVDGEDTDGDSGLRVSEAFTAAFHVLVNVRKDSVAAKESADTVVSWLEKENFDIPAKLHAALADAYALIARSEHSEVGYAKYVSQAMAHYSKSLELEPQSTVVATNYARELAEAGKTTEALEIVRNGLLDDKTYIPAWHLMALLLSVQEEFETAIKVVNTALAISSDQAATQDSKTQKLQLKKTQVALIEATAGSEAALDKLPEVFSTFTELFAEQKPPSSAAAQAEESANALAPSRSRMSIFKGRTASTRPVRPVTPKPAVATPDKDHLELLKHTWLWAAGVYRRASLWNEADQAIVEAENLGGQCPETHTEMGLLMFSERPQNAMDEFETALDIDHDHLSAVLGLAQLILEQADSDTVFQSKDDAAAARARILGLVETLSQRSPGRRNSECFWVLSQLYESANRDEVHARQALWRCIALEESRPVRDFSCIY